MLFVCKKNKKYKHNTKVTLRLKNKDITITIPFIDNAYIENVITGFLISKILGFDTKKLIKKIENLEVISMRMEEVEGINNCNIINDYYNSDLESVKNSIEFFRRKK